MTCTWPDCCEIGLQKEATATTFERAHRKRAPVSSRHGGAVGLVVRGSRNAGLAAGVTLVGLAVLAPLAISALLAWLAHRTWLRIRRERAIS